MFTLVNSATSKHNAHSHKWIRACLQQLGPQSLESVFQKYAESFDNVNKNTVKNAVRDLVTTNEVARGRLGRTTLLRLPNQKFAENVTDYGYDDMSATRQEPVPKARATPSTVTVGSTVLPWAVAVEVSRIVQASA